MWLLFMVKESLACVDFPILIFAVKVFMYLFILKYN